MQIVHDFKALHKIPELDHRLPKTRAYLQKSLQALPCRVWISGSGALFAYFDHGKDRTVAFRADMDGLPVREQTGLVWQSEHPDRMHACGHDGHMAILLELARRLTGWGKYNYLLIFQPAEETTGGAWDICREGVLETWGVCAVFGLHLWPGLPKGRLYTRPGMLMSAAAGIRGVFRGEGRHVAQTGRDALAAACLFHTRAAAIRTEQPHLLKFGMLHGGTAPNVTCEQAVLEGTLRTWDQGQLLLLQQRLDHLFRQTLQETTCGGKLFFRRGYPAVCNDPQLYEKAQKCAPAQLLQKPVWTTEDFSYYQQRVPGVYYLLGLGNTPPLHSSGFRFDPQVLSVGADHFYRLASEL